MFETKNSISKEIKFAVNCASERFPQTNQHFL